MNNLTRRAFAQVNVFSSDPVLGNPVAVVLAADGLSEHRMAAFARWTNLSETTFILPPTDPRADYRLRIFTTLEEMPFAGHPTLGSCHAWLESGGRPSGEDVVQECGIGLVRIRRKDGRLSFQAPPLLRDSVLDADLLARVVTGLALQQEEVMDARWVDNGGGWLAVRLRSRASVLAARPAFEQLAGLKIGVFGPWEAGSSEDVQFESRAFIAGDGVPEDPATGSLNAGIARWLRNEEYPATRYVISQGTALGRAGRIHVECSGNEVWIGGECATCITGTAVLGE
ncbi:PhzF family phenazine biosynthesis protein [Stenotrophomonas sp. TWI700]|uniref:PhzF family phenazine biosynthesis protein n=1 Tax=Stenotrophomonas sp. TWI700 TaxID=3136792 RepID=UPI00320B20B3